MNVQWLRLCTSHAVGVGLIPGQGTRVPHAEWYYQKKKKKKSRMKVSREGGNEDILKNGQFD